MEGLGNELNTEEPIVFTMHEEEKEGDLFVHATCEGGDAPQATFVDELFRYLFVFLKIYFKYFEGEF